MKVFKYNISSIGAPGMDLDPPNLIEMPMASRVVAVGLQHGIMKLWAEVDEGTEDNLVDRKFWVIGTGWPIEMAGRRMIHIGTVLENDGDFVWHVYEEKAVAV